MKRPITSIEDLEMLEQCFAAYGADVAKWPEDKRKAYGEFAHCDEAASMREDAKMLDEFLSAASAPQMTPELKRVILAQYKAPSATGPSGLFKGWFPAIRLAPAGALAGIGALGVFSGVLSASVQAGLPPEAEVYAYAEDISLLAMLDEEEALSWDEE